MEYLEVSGWINKSCANRVSETENKCDVKIIENIFSKNTGTCNINLMVWLLIYNMSTHQIISITSDG